MNKEELVLFAHDTTKLPKSYISIAIDDFIGWVSDAIKEGNDVKLNGFGSFCIEEKRSRKYIDPATMTLPEDQRKWLQSETGKRIVFKPGSRMMRALDEE